MPVFNAHLIDGAATPQQPTPPSRDRVTQRSDQRPKRPERSSRTTIDRIVAELAEVESWESLAQRAGRRAALGDPAWKRPGRSTLACGDSFGDALTRGLSAS